MCVMVACVNDGSVKCHTIYVPSEVRIEKGGGGGGGGAEGWLF